MITKQEIPEQILTRVMASIDQKQVSELALALANIDSPTGREGAVSDYIFNWLDGNGFEPKRVGLFPDRCNIAARIHGTGGGPSLLLNSHMDTTIASDETLTTVHAADPIYHSGWREGTRLFGNGVLNNKGVMASWMIACKALKSAGVRLKGDVVMTMVVGEIGLEPVDEFQSPQYLAKEAGARFLVNRGYVADYAIVAEGTDFTVGWVEAGKAFFKVTVMGEDPPVYTPYIRYTKSLEESPNAIERSAKVISAIKEWAVQYEQDNRYECAGGTVLPKVNIGAIRGGVPYKITKTPAVCYLYVDTRITPVQKPLAVQRELQDMLAKTGVPATAELYAYRRGYEATGVEPLLESLGRAHRRLFNAEPGRPIAPITSMWRDSNVFIEAGVPTVVYGPGGSVGGGVFAMEEEHLLLGARAYALTLLETCKVDLG